MHFILLFSRAVESIPWGSFTVSRRSDFIVVSAHCAFGTLSRRSSLNSRVRAFLSLAGVAPCALAPGGCDRWPSALAFWRLRLEPDFSACFRLRRLRPRFVLSTLGTQISPCLDRFRSFCSLLLTAESEGNPVDPVQLENRQTRNCNKVTCIK